MAPLSLKAFNELHMSSNLQHKFEAQIKMWLFLSRTHWFITMDHVLNIIRTLEGGSLNSVTCSWSESCRKPRFAGIGNIFY